MTDVPADRAEEASDEGFDRPLLDPAFREEVRRVVALGRAAHARGDHAEYRKGEEGSASLRRLLPEATAEAEAHRRAETGGGEWLPADPGERVGTGAIAPPAAVPGAFHREVPRDPQGKSLASNCVHLAIRPRILKDSREGLANGT
ncbi:hypothetical protein [Roseicella aerolata]|uniref:Uncharacterized protein n=1 Tax=Roseicella aerolata TaxID=2883479 RepID=A0A9X1IHY8_9PROT|nr:hypothetical protein [Roseicella aerolata]MCB4824506.1 hypothetical protein [Roseicella aerolata]